MNRTVIIVVLIVVLLGGFALVQSQKKSAPTQTPTINTSSTEPTKTEASPATSGAVMQPENGTTAVKEFTVEGKNFSFTPSTLTVNKGDKVKITFKNTDGFHDFRIDEFNVAAKQIQGGASETVEFTADKTGSFEYYCGVGNHRAMGMKGTLTVK